MHFAAAPPSHAVAPERARALALAALMVALGFGCGGNLESRAASTDEHGRPAGGGAWGRLPWSYTALGSPPEPVDNPPTPEKIALGRALFHDPVLSGDRATACVTCHSQYWGMGDGLPFAIGVGGSGPSGLGRTGPTRTRRNAPSLWNVAYRSALFWDGRVSSLEQQIGVPLVDARELGADLEMVMRDLAENGTYRLLFEAAFLEPPAVTARNLARAIAAFVRTIVTNDAPYDRYARGDDNAMSAAEIRGMFLFGELGCGTCHPPPMFGADRFDAVATGGGTATHIDEGGDLGRFEVTGDANDRFAFRVPQLRNLRETGPYFHDGHAPTMKEALFEMAVATSPRAVSDGELDSLVEFVSKGLMDKTHAPERPLAVPSGLPVPADGFVIRR
jgi:cytochrome c peroxidase